MALSRLVCALGQQSLVAVLHCLGQQIKILEKAVQKRLKYTPATHVKVWPTVLCDS